MKMRVCVTDIATRETLFISSFSTRQRVSGLSIGSGDRDNIQVPGLKPGAMQVIIRGKHSFLVTGDEHVPDTAMKQTAPGEYRVKNGTGFQAGGCRIEFMVAQAKPIAQPGKTCFTKLFLTLVYELARMEHGAEAMLHEFDLPVDGSDEPFEKWVFAQIEAASAGRIDMSDVIRNVRRRFARLSAMQMASYQTLQDCVNRVRDELDPSAIFGKSSAMERLFGSLGGRQRYLDAYNGAFASTQRFYNEYVYPTARLNLLRQLENRKSIAVLKTAV